MPGGDTLTPGRYTRQTRWQPHGDTAATSEHTIKLLKKPGFLPIPTIRRAGTPNISDGTDAKDRIGGGRSRVLTFLHLFPMRGALFFCRDLVNSRINKPILMVWLVESCQLTGGEQVPNHENRGIRRRIGNRVSPITRGDAISKTALLLEISITYGR